MIKANELRIGNCVKLNNSYTTLVPRDFQRYCKSFGIFEEFEPIELSEEWLLKAGYKKQNGYGYSNYKIYGTILKNDNGFEFHYYGIIIRLDFVHQLQNLFFSFYGEDLVFSTEP